VIKGRRQQRSDRVNKVVCVARFVLTAAHTTMPFVIQSCCPFFTICCVQRTNHMDDVRPSHVCIHGPGAFQHLVIEHSSEGPLRSSTLLGD